MDLDILPRPDAGVNRLGRRPGLPFFGEVRRRRAYFDDCLAMPDTASLIGCVFGFTEFDAGVLPPEGYTPPFTDGMCASLDVVCPA